MRPVHRQQAPSVRHASVSTAELLRQHAKANTPRGATSARRGRSGSLSEHTSGGAPLQLRQQADNRQGVRTCVDGGFRRQAAEPSLQAKSNRFGIRPDRSPPRIDRSRRTNDRFTFPPQQNIENAGANKLRFPTSRASFTLSVTILISNPQFAHSPHIPSARQAFILASRKQRRFIPPSVCTAFTPH